MKKRTDPSNALSFISSGVACFAFFFLETTGIINELVKSTMVDKRTFSNCKHSLLIDRAILELQLHGVISEENDHIKLSPLGEELLDYSGLITYIYSGYVQHLSNPQNIYSKINHDSVVKGSNQLGEQFIDSAIMQALKKRSVKKSLCDLGCGNGLRLIRVCKEFSCNGLGFELESVEDQETKSHTSQSPLIRIETGDISQLQGTWEEVDVLMQIMVMHDFSDATKCAGLIHSFLSHFPNLRYFFYSDIVAPSDSIKTQLPGFDYIHATLGIKTRTYEETLCLFNAAGFFIDEEIAIEKMPNTFLWVLKPKKSPPMNNP